MDHTRGLISRSHLLAAGFSDEELRRMLATERLTALRPGIYVASDDDRLRDPVASHALAVHAALRQVGGGAVVSHVSAAVLHGLPVWRIPLVRVHLTRARRSGGRRNRVLHLHAAPLDADEVVSAGGIAVTLMARTVADLARCTAFENAVVTADAAVRRDMHREDLIAVVERAACRRGNTAARRVAAFADGRAESVGESRSRVALHLAGLPSPVLQWEVCSPSGAVVARVDFGWPELRTVGEFDGRVKYGRLLRPGQDPGDAVSEEKRRERARRGTAAARFRPLVTTPHALSGPRRPDWLCEDPNRRAERPAGCGRTAARGAGRVLDGGG